MEKKYHIALLLLLPSVTHSGLQKAFQPIESFNFTEEQTVESFDELFQQGNRSFHEQNYQQAIEQYTKAAALHPECPHTHFNLGQALFFAKQYGLALDEFKKTVKLQPDHPYAYAQIGRLLFDVQQYNDAIIPFKHVLHIDPKNVDIRLLLTQIYTQQQLYDKALKTLDKGLALDPNNLNLRFEKANIYNTVNKLEEALEIYTTLDHEVPNNASIIYNIAFTLKKLGFVAESLDYYNRAIELNPDHSDAKFSRGLAYLVLGNFEKGWEGYEWRYHKPEQGSLRSFTQPRWQGEDLTGKTILIHSEQGLGDTFQFIRYAQLLKKNNCTVIAAVQKPLVDLLRLCPYIDNVVIINDTNLPAFDVQAPMMSLPYIMKTSIDTIPNTIPYLFADETLVELWKEKLSSDKKFKIGICWQGNDNYATPTLRMAVALKSIQAHQFSVLSTIPGVSLYSLQKTTGTDQLKNLPADVTIISFDEDFDQTHGRFMDTAAVMRNLDLIITVDTSVCHLASALGVPTWVMLPNPADWRWMINRDDSPWYPEVMRLIKQPTPGDWDNLLLQVAEELKKLLAERNQ